MDAHEVSERRACRVLSMNRAAFRYEPVLLPDEDIIRADIMIMRFIPEYLRSDNGSEFIAKKLRQWLNNLGVITTYIEPGSPWENGYCESFNSRMRDEFLNGELFGNLYETEVLTKRWVKYYNEIRPHSGLGGRPPAP